MKLELYHMMQCPFSAKVRNYIESNNLKAQIVYHDVDEEGLSGEAMIEKLGSDQVPCLVIDGKPMLESDDIIAWLGDNLKAAA